MRPALSRALVEDDGRGAGRGRVGLLPWELSINFNDVLSIPHHRFQSRVISPEGPRTRQSSVDKMTLKFNCLGQLRGMIRGRGNGDISWPIEYSVCSPKIKLNNCGITESLGL